VRQVTGPVFVLPCLHPLSLNKYTFAKSGISNYADSATEAHILMHADLQEQRWGKSFQNQAAAALSRVQGYATSRKHAQPKLEQICSDFAGILSKSDTL